jgi:UPF0176 acylphosphatase like domain
MTIKDHHDDDTVERQPHHKRKKRLSKHERKALKKKSSEQQQQQQQQKKIGLDLQEQKHMMLLEKEQGGMINIEADNDSSNKKNKKKNKNRKKQEKQQKQQEQEEKQQSKDSKSTSSASINEVASRKEEDEAQILARCMKSYVPIEVPTKPCSRIMLASNTNNQNNKKSKSSSSADGEGGEGEEGGGLRSLGKWFPTAILVKCHIHYTNTGQLLVHNQQQQVQVQQPANPRASLALFYQYHNNKSCHWDKQQLELLMTYLQTIAQRRNIGGRIRVAPEGVNATLSAVDTAATDGSRTTAQSTLRHLALDLQRFDPIFKNTDFKFIDDLSPDRHFKELKILPVQELVFYDIQADEAPLNHSSSTDDNSNNTKGTMTTSTAIDGGNATAVNGDAKEESSSSKVNSGSSGGGVHHLDAHAYHEMLQRENTVVIDVRNHYEAILGRFDGQMMKKNSHKQQATAAAAATSADVKTIPSSSSLAATSTSPDSATIESKNDGRGGGGGGAEYIDPKMRKSTDFKQWLSKEETKEQIKGKTVMMFVSVYRQCRFVSFRFPIYHVIDLIDNMVPVIKHSITLTHSFDFLCVVQLFGGWCLLSYSARAGSDVNVPVST